MNQILAQLSLAQLRAQLGNESNCSPLFGRLLGERVRAWLACLYEVCGTECVSNWSCLYD